MYLMYLFRDQGSAPLGATVTAVGISVLYQSVIEDTYTNTQPQGIDLWLACQSDINHKS